MSTTNLHLEFPDFDKKYFNYIEINSQIVEIKKNYEDIIIKKTINREHFNEEIKLFNNKNDYVKHKIDIYQNKNNNFNCFISSKNAYTFELYNYNKKK